MVDIIEPKSDLATLFVVLELLIKNVKDELLLAILEENKQIVLIIS